MCLRTGTNMSVHHLIIKPELSSTPTHIDGLRHLIALNISESETGAKDETSEGDEMVGKTTGEDCCIQPANALKIHLQHHKVQLYVYHQPQAGYKKNSFS
jgi:hypothetical protein